jgi:uncharacterized membrane protein YqgA involved in biofilm formation
MTGTLINVATVLAGAGLGTALGHRLPERIQRTALAGLGLLTLVVGIQLALAWSGPNTTKYTSIYVLGAVVIGGLLGEWIGIERRLGTLGDRIQARMARSGEHSTISEGFVTASLLFCVGSLAVVGSIQDGLTGDVQTLATKALLDGVAAVALAASLGWGVALSAISILLYQGTITLGAGAFETVLQGESLAALSSAGGITIIGISLKLLEIRDVGVGNFLPALIVAPVLVAIF